MSKKNQNLKVPNLTMQEVEQSSAIMLSVEIKSSFELYAYRIISDQQFVERIKELIGNFNNSVKPKL